MRGVVTQQLLVQWPMQRLQQQRTMHAGQLPSSCCKCAIGRRSAQCAAASWQATTGHTVHVTHTHVPLVLPLLWRIDRVFTA
jgi:transposase